MSVPIFAGRGRPRRRAFTLIELLVVLSILMLLVTILFPSLRSAREHAYKSMCQANIAHLVQALHAHSIRKDATLPPPYGWISFVGSTSAGAALKCPKDYYEEDRPAGEPLVEPGPIEHWEDPRVPADIENVYIMQRHQNNYWRSYVTDVLAGRPTEDPQIVLDPARTPHMSDHCYCWIPDLRPNQHLICMDDDSALLITFEEYRTRLESLDPEGDTHCVSDHWVCLGDGGDDWENEILFQLTGTGYQNTIDPRCPYYLTEDGGAFSGEGPPGTDGGAGFTGAASYAMNVHVRRKMPRLGQVLLVEYTQSKANVFGTDEDGPDVFADKFAPRHFDKGNVAFVDGSVRAMAMEQVDPQPAGVDRAIARMWQP